MARRAITISCIFANSETVSNNILLFPPCHPCQRSPNILGCQTCRGPSGTRIMLMSLIFTEVNGILRPSACCRIRAYNCRFYFSHHSNAATFGVNHGSCLTATIHTALGQQVKKNSVSNENVGGKFRAAEGNYPIWNLARTEAK